MARRTYKAGDKFGRLTWTGDNERRTSTSGKSRHTVWLMACECGTKKWVRQSNVASGHARSCGCLHREAMQSEDRREALSQRMRERWESSEWREQMREVSHGVMAENWSRPGWREEAQERSGQVMRERWADPVFREQATERNSRTMRERWADPEHRQALGESISQALSTPEHRERVSQQARTLWADPEWRAHHTGERHAAWRGDAIGYSGAHSRVKAERGPARTWPCVDCGDQARDWSLDLATVKELGLELLTADVPGRLEDGCQYSSDTRAYRARCRPCHQELDGFAIHLQVSA